MTGLGTQSMQKRMYLLHNKPYYKFTINIVIRCSLIKENYNVFHLERTSDLKEILTKNVPNEYKLMMVYQLHSVTHRLLFSTFWN